MSNPSTDYYWQALERVMRYLVGTMSYEIYYSGHPAVLRDIMIQTGYLLLMRFMPQLYVFTLGGGAIS